ncbi:uncharacterized protein N0V89_001352 [Didymosphaeria variabile]|uniref:Uncharacterized protein n=1 Tax=Didymosphaeria variabile TaxID=1932322 RepID=A0A9W9CGN6_9PLEO|nr:uncharacterized protein N0V89_001352 [Didymosphaeria variabile]KAJ4360785.1 hypothetical protein N0V89_001352 [Didymosphaeria variabile]
MSSSSAAFWAKNAHKIGQLRGVLPPSPDQETKPTEPTPAEASVSKQFGSGHVFKVKKDCGTKSPEYPSSAFTSTATTSPLSPSTATSWADSVEEDEAQADADAAAAAAAAGHGAGRNFQPMPGTVIQQAKRIQELETTIVHQAKRIVDLEGDVKDKDANIEHLTGAIEEKEAHISRLEANIIDRDTHIANLTSQVDEEIRRTKKLRDELQEKMVLVQDLELQVAETISVPDSGSLTEVEEDAEEESLSTPARESRTVLMAEACEDIDVPGDTTAGAIAAALEAQTPIKPETATSSEDEFPALSPVDFPALGSPTPVRDLKRSPFVTADNIKKVPPPPPARTLKLGIDPSKFQKKSVAGHGGRFMFGSRRANEGPPKIDTSKDIRKMSKEEREPFGYGPTVQFIIGNDTVASLPKYMLMQVSSKAFNHWTANPTALTIKFDAGSMTKEALNIHLEWITMHTHCSRVYSVSLKPENSDRYNLEIVRCARVLGLHSMYMGHFTRLYCQKVRDGPTDELIALIEELAYTDDEPIFDCLANNMAMQHSKAKAEDLQDWNIHLARLPKLAAKIQDIQARKNFAQGKTYSKGKKALPPQKAAEEVATTAVTADIDPDAAWRAVGPAYV